MHSLMKKISHAHQQTAWLIPVLVALLSLYKKRLTGSGWLNLWHKALVEFFFFSSISLIKFHNIPKFEDCNKKEHNHCYSNQIIMPGLISCHPLHIFTK